MNSATEFWGLMGLLVIAGVAWMAGCRKFFKWLDKRKKKKKLKGWY